MTSFPPKMCAALAGDALPGSVSGSQLSASLPALRLVSFLSGSAHDSPSRPVPQCLVGQPRPVPPPLTQPLRPWPQCLSKTQIHFELLPSWETSQVSTACEIKAKLSGMSIQALRKTGPNFFAHFQPLPCSLLPVLKPHQPFMALNMPHTLGFFVLSSLLKEPGLWLLLCPYLPLPRPRKLTPGIRMLTFQSLCKISSSWKHCLPAQSP